MTTAYAHVLPEMLPDMASGVAFFHPETEYAFDKSTGRYVVVRVDHDNRHPVQAGQFTEDFLRCLMVDNELMPEQYTPVHVIKGKVTIVYARPMWYREQEQRTWGLKKLPEECASFSVSAGDVDMYGDAFDLLVMIEAHIRNMELTSWCIVYED